MFCILLCIHKICKRINTIVGFSDISTLDEYRSRSEVNARFLDETLALFKGELSLNEILYELPKKRLLELREARIKRLTEEQNSLKEQQKKQERQAIQDQILQK